MHPSIRMNYRILDPPMPTGVLAVKSDATGSGDGSTWGNAYTTFQAALAAAVGAGASQIWVAEATYRPHASDRTATFQMVAGVDCYGGFRGTRRVETYLEQRDYVNRPTYLAGDLGGSADPLDWSHHILTGNVDATLDGFTVQKGNDTLGSGGAGLCFGITTIRNCTFSDCHTTAYGGAIYHIYGVMGGLSAMTVDGCTFDECTSTGAGGQAIEIDFGASLTVTDCIFTDCVDANGSATVYSYYITDAVITGNVVSGCKGYDAGGIYIVGDNAAPGDYTATVSGNVVVGNDAVAGTGGIIYLGATVTDANNTVTDNTDLFGLVAGGLAVEDAAAVTMTDSIVYGNTGSADFSVDTANGATLTATYSDLEGGYAGTGNIDSDPLFVDSTDPVGPDLVWWSADDGLELDTGSPCDGTGSAGGNMGAY